MKTVFADTSYYIALATSKDDAYAAAKVFSDRFRGQQITSEYVLLELGNFFSKFTMRSAFVALYDALLRDPKTVILPCSDRVLKRAVDMYRTRQDKEWSLTDCTSFILMKENDVIHALSTERHFEQAGFSILLPRG